jgi:hypothetical protein
MDYIKKFIKKCSLFYEDHRLVRKLSYIALLSLPVVIVFLPYITQPKTIMGYDWDYFSQMYEAFRISVIKYQQFPWFNPWVAGGVPLYANPQFGLLSIQSFFVLIFGTLAGLKISVVAYALLGFWGIFCLLKYNDINNTRSMLLGYIFIFGGFGIYHVTGGHLTFAVYYLIPFLLLSFQRLLKESKWVAFALMFSLCLLTASHYIILQFILILYGIAILSIWKKPYQKSIKDLIIIYSKSLLLILLLTSHKIFFSFQYLRSYPRIGNDSVPVSIITLIKSLLTPPSPYNHVRPPGLIHSWGEYSAYAGIFLIIVFFITVYFIIKNKNLLDRKVKVALLVMLSSLLLAAGRFSKYSPFNILGELPVYGSMIVPARWMGWFFFGMVILIGIIKLTKKQNKLINVLLTCSAIEMAIFTIPYISFMNPNIKYVDTFRNEYIFQQYDDFGIDSSMRYFKGTRANYGEVRGYEAILDYNLYRPTNRCGTNKGCGLILTGNASLDYWSSNKIVISRTGPGEIKININPGSYWLVNGKRLWPNEKVVVLNKDFSLDDSQQKYELKISPSLSLSPQ